jgi:hypothetical protein
MKQFILSLKRRKQDSSPNYISPARAARAFIRLPVEWKLLTALLLLMAFRLAAIVAFVLQQL